MSIQFYEIIHFFSVIILTAVTFWALASPQTENRRRVTMFSGILALLALVSGFGLLARLGLSMQGWVFVKLACWLGFTALTSLAYRRSEAQRRPLVLLTVVAVFLAVSMVVMKPF